MLKTFEYFLKTYFISLNFCKNIFFNKSIFLIYFLLFILFYINVLIFF